jgi:uncharacterized protein
MTAVTPFATLRLIISSLTVFAQIYLFARIWLAIRSSHRSSRFQTPAVVLAGASITLLFGMNLYILSRPIPWADPPEVFRIVLFFTPAVWIVGSIFSALLLLLTDVARGLFRLAVRLDCSPTGQKIPPVVNTDRRRFLQAGVGALATAPFIMSGYGALYAGRTCVVRELSLPFGCPLRVVQLTDIHAGIYMTREDIRRYADRVIALEPDLFILTGDYISNSMVFFPGFVEEIARVRARYGTFATLGNHEHWFGKVSDFETIFRRHGIPLLNNAHRVIHTAGGPFAVVGIDDLRSGQPDLEAALRGLDPLIPKLLLSHRPEIFPEAANRGIPITLSGHYHGGQIKLSLPNGDFSLAHLRTPYPEGLYRIDDSSLYVSRGIGTTFTPVRLNARPEVTLIHLT